MAVTNNSIDAVMNEIDRLHGILAEDVAGLEKLDPNTSAPVIAAKRKVGSVLESTRRELEALKAVDNKWVRDTLKF